MEPYQVVLQELLKVPESYTAGEDEIRMHCPVCNEINSFHAFYCRSCGAALHKIGRG